MWSEREEHYRTRRLIWTLVIFYVVGGLAALVWVLFIAPIQQMSMKGPGTEINLNLVLAPVVVLAALNELIVERVFDVVEGSWRSLVAYFGYGMRRLKAAEQEVASTRDALDDAAEYYFNMQYGYKEKIRQEMDKVRKESAPRQAIRSESLDRLQQEANAKIQPIWESLQDAEAHVNEAATKLESLGDALGYQRAKRLMAMHLSFMLGIVWAGLGSLQLFTSLGILVPARIDVILTGLIIGSIQTPVHSIVGGIQDIKDAVVSRSGSDKQSNDK